jgi:ADP-dependent NAD(P)H-hydrate dehydratase / NAD(P)H-hydrate epimerase
MGAAMKILNGEQMRNIDRRASEQFGIPSILLMENAARAVAHTVRTHYPEAETVAIFCGPGQNGGDGFAAARHLANGGVIPLLFVLADRTRYSGDSATNLAICERLSLPMWDIADGEQLDQALARASQTDLVVDAIFGTGLNRPPEGIHAEAIRGMQSLRLPIVAVDVPSGLDASSSEAPDPVVRADVTVTFALPKIAHIFAPASECCGEIAVADISIPAAALEGENVLLALTTAEDIAPLFAEREPATHKGSYGHLAIVGGSAGRSGAAILAARAAVRSGAGLVTVLTDAETARLVDTASVETMTVSISADAAAVAKRLDRFDAVVLGPGLPDDEESYAFVRRLVPLIERPLLVDASGLNAFAGKAEELRSDSGARVITPHPGELGRLLGIETAEVNRRRFEIAAEAARRSGCVVVLKGHLTVVADPDGHIAVNPTGNAGMASGGMGDVLSGLLGALLARNSDPFEASRAGVYLHGLAGDILRDETSDIGLAAMDVAETLPLAVRMVRGEDE